MKTLAIGYGNTLRSDDGAGYRVAEILESWQVPGVEAWAAHQLLPEMAAAMAEVDLVVFIDVRASRPAAGMECRSLTVEAQTLQTHQFEPATLLALAQQLYGRQPPAYWLLLPAANFAFGEEFSAGTQAAVEQALAKIVELAGLTPEQVNA